MEESCILAYLASFLIQFRPRGPGMVLPSVDAHINQQKCPIDNDAHRSVWWRSLLFPGNASVLCGQKPITDIICNFNDLRTVFSSLVSASVEIPRAFVLAVSSICHSKKPALFKAILNSGKVDGEWYSHFFPMQSHYPQTEFYTESHSWYVTLTFHCYVKSRVYSRLPCYTFHEFWKYNNTYSLVHSSKESIYLPQACKGMPSLLPKSFLQLLI